VGDLAEAEEEEEELGRRARELRAVEPAPKRPAGEAEVAAEDEEHRPDKSRRAVADAAAAGGVDLGTPPTRRRRSSIPIRATAGPTRRESKAPVDS